MEGGRSRANNLNAVNVKVNTTMLRATGANTSVDAVMMKAILTSIADVKHVRNVAITIAGICDMVVGTEDSTRNYP